MIVSIRGKLLRKTPGSIIVEANGLGYECHISVNTYDSLPEIGSEVALLTFYHVTENSHALYGFSAETERSLFTMLTSVSGIGPKTAIGLLSAVSPEEFKRRLIAGEVKMLTALPGIGPKTARRIIVDLKDKFVKLAEDELPIEGDELILPAIKEAHEALVALGFKAQDVRKTINKISRESDGLTTEQVVKKALSQLS